MWTQLPYLLQVQIILTMLWLFYSQLLQRDPRLGLCRAYLLLSVPVAWLLPLLHIPVFPGPEIPLSLFQAVYSPLAAGEPIAEVSGPDARFWFALAALAGSLALGVRSFVGALPWLRLMRRRPQEEGVYKGLRLVDTERVETACSLFGWVFLNRGQVRQQELSHVLRHEMAHVELRHSWDMLLGECMRILLWWNPAVWMWHRSLVEVHEYQADRAVLEREEDMEPYVRLLLRSCAQVNPSLVSGFSYSLLRKRLGMIGASQRGFWSRCKIALVIPLLGLLLGLFSFTQRAAVLVNDLPEADAEGSGAPVYVAGDHAAGMVSDLVGSTTGGYGEARARDISSLPGSSATKLRMSVDGRQVSGEELEKLNPKRIDAITIHSAEQGGELRIRTRTAPIKGAQRTAAGESLENVAWIDPATVSKFEMQDGRLHIRQVARKESPEGSGAAVRRQEAPLREQEAAIRTEAREQAARAHEQAARVREQSAVVRAQATQAREQAAQVHERAAQAREQAAEAREQAAEAREQAAQARERAAEIRQQAAQVREQSAVVRAEAAQVREQAVVVRAEAARVREQSAAVREQSARIRQEAAAESGWKAQSQILNDGKPFDAKTTKARVIVDGKEVPSDYLNTISSERIAGIVVRKDKETGPEGEIHITTKAAKAASKASSAPSQPAAAAPKTVPEVSARDIFIVDGKRVDASAVNELVRGKNTEYHIIKKNDSENEIHFTTTPGSSSRQGTLPSSSSSAHASRPISAPAAQHEIAANSLAASIGKNIDTKALEQARLFVNGVPTDLAGLRHLSPETVESITVLKDRSEPEIYVTTKAEAGKKKEAKASAR